MDTSLDFYALERDARWTGGASNLHNYFNPECMQMLLPEQRKTLIFV